MKLRRNLMYLLLAAAACLLGEVSLAQDTNTISRNYELREVRNIDIKETTLPGDLKKLESGHGGVIGVVFVCDPTVLTGRVTPYVILLKAPKSVSIGQEFEIEIAAVNPCDTPLDMPISPSYVQPDTKEVQYMSIVRLGLASSDERIDFEGREYLFGSTDHPETVQRLMRHEYIRVRMKVRAKLAKGVKTDQFEKAELIDTSPIFEFWERNSDRMNGGTWGPLPATTVGGSNKDILLRPK